MTAPRLGLSERAYAAHAGVSRGAVQKARERYDARLIVIEGRDCNPQENSAQGLKPLGRKG